MRHIFIFFLGVFLPNLLAAQARIPYEFRRLAINDGLPDNTVYTCLQDSRGYMWFCTSNGVSRFDGRTFQNFTIADGLSDNEIIAATEDIVGRIWFHTINGRLSYFDLKTEKIVSYRTSEPLQKANGVGYLSVIAVGSDSSVWFMFEQRILKRLMYNGEVGAYDFRYKSVAGVFEDEQKRIYLMGDTIRLFDAQKDVFENWLTFPKEKEGSYFGKWYTKKGALLIEGLHSIFEFKNSVLTKVTSKDFLKRQFLNSISADSLGHLWFCASNGYFKMSPKSSQKYQFYTTNSQISYVFLDKEGNQWVCTLGDGVYFYPSGSEHITTLDKRSGLENEVVTALAKDASGNIVAATYPNFLHILDKKTGQVSRKIQLKGKWDVRVRKLYFPNKTDFWVQTDNFRLDYFPNFSKNTPPQYDPTSNKNKDFLPLSYVAAPIRKLQNGEYSLDEFLNILVPFKNIFFAKNGRIYMVSGTISEAELLPNKRVKCRFFYENLRTRFYSIAEDTHGVIWFGGTEGVCFLRPDAQDVEFIKANFETAINDIIVLSDDYLLCSTSGNGVFLLKNGQIIKNWQEKDGMSSNSCNHMVKRDDQTVFVGTAKGVTRLNFDPNDPSRMYAIIYGGKDAKPALFVNDLLLEDEKLYIASNNGLYSFKINDLKIQRNIPTLRLTQPEAYLVHSDTFLQLNYGWFEHETEIKFNFRALAYCNGEVMHYRYRLFRDGALEKKDSIALRENFTLSLVSLNSGSYILEVETSRGDDIWSKPVRTRFEVGKPIYRKTFALFLYWLVFALFTFELLRRRGRNRSRKEQRALARKEERLALERRQLEWEQEAIRARIDPHFVFNALNGILTFVYKRDIDSLKIQLPRLARFIRLSLNLGGEDFITVEQEVQYLNDYLSLEKRRFEEKFDYSIKITEGVDAMKKLLPPLLLQIFVENSVKHGISSLPETEIGFISIIFENIENNTLRCTITDNGRGLSKSMNDKIDDSNHISLGLNLAKRRISLLNQIYGQKYTLHISDDETGTKVILAVKLENP